MINVSYDIVFYDECHCSVSDYLFICGPVGFCFSRGQFRVNSLVHHLNFKLWENFLNSITYYSPYPITS